MWETRSTTSTAIPETTERGPVDSVTEDILTTISQEVTTVFEEYITSTETSLDPELGMYINHPTGNPTMATVPIYQASASSKPGSITEAILEGLGGYASEPPMELNMREYDDQEATSGAASSGGSPDYASAAIILAGSCYVLHKLDKVLKSLYGLACYKSDPRLIATGHRENSLGTRAWAWTATILERSWIPLWFSNQRLRDEAVDNALDDIFQAQRIRNHGYLQRELEDIGDYLDNEAEIERQEALDRQLER